MGDKKEKKKKESTAVVLPKAWKTLKHRNETAQARANWIGLLRAIGAVFLVALIAYILLGGMSIKGLFSFASKWSNKIGNGIMNWLSGVNVVEEDGDVYIDPTGKKGSPIIETPTPRPDTQDNSNIEDENNEETPQEQNEGDESINGPPSD